MTRREQAMWAFKLEKALGNGYRIWFDACDSGMTYCYYNDRLYKKVENEAMCGSINVNDFKIQNN